MSVRVVLIVGAGPSGLATAIAAKQRGLDVEVARFPWSASGRALGMGRSEGMTKLVFARDGKRVLGAGIVGPHAGDLIAECALAIELGADVEDVALTVHPHPTLSETIGLAAILDPLGHHFISIRIRTEDHHHGALLRLGESTAMFLHRQLGRACETAWPQAFDTASPSPPSSPRRTSTPRYRPGRPEANNKFATPPLDRIRWPEPRDRSAA